MNVFNKKAFWNSIGIIALAEMLSFSAFREPEIAPWVFALVAVGVVALTMTKLEWGITILFGELVVGSLGKMFVLPIDGFDVTIRMFIWFVVLCVWVLHARKRKHAAFIHSSFFMPYAVFAGVLIWGVAWGLIQNHPLAAVFSDANNYFFLLIIFPLYDVHAQRHWYYIFSSMLAAAMLWLSLKTIAFFYVFSHELFFLQDSLYEWSRFSRLAEITNIDPAVVLSRIFMQSQIWLVVGFFVLLAYMYCLTREKKFDKELHDIPAAFVVGWAILFLSAIVISFSRSFWLAMAVSFLALCALIWVSLKRSVKEFFRYLAISGGVIVVSVALVVGIARVPLPRGSASADLIRERAGKITGEAAVSSRYAQIVPLLRASAAHPVLGSGFGSSVTYQSMDPRVLKDNPGGRYTTTAFEMGYLDMLLKIGLLGIMAYAYIVIVIIISLLRAAVRAKTYQTKALLAGCIAGVIALVLTHGISPYLNHPLGIGIIALMTAIAHTCRVQVGSVKPAVAELDS